MGTKAPVGIAPELLRETKGIRQRVQSFFIQVMTLLAAMFIVYCIILLVSFGVWEAFIPLVLFMIGFVELQKKNIIIVFIWVVQRLKEMHQQKT